MLYKILLLLLYATTFLITSTASNAADKHELRNDRQLFGRMQQAQGHANQHKAFGLSQSESLQLIATQVDRHGNQHSRYRQTIGAIPVWGEQIIISRDSSGKVQGLHGRLVKGLANEIAYFLPAFSAEQALQQMQQNFIENPSNNEKFLFENESVELVIYLDSGRAVLSYAISFFADTESGGKPTRPTYIIDAGTGELLFEYEGLTHALIGTGPGGNEKTGQYFYDSNLNGNGNLDVLYAGSSCTMKNEQVKTVDLNNLTTGSTAYSYGCDESTNYFNNYRSINGAYSPLNDAHFFGSVVFNMYQQWIGAAPLDFQLMMRVHYSNNYENAFWNGSSMTFGDGATRFYPLVSLDVSAHEVSHGFTEQHSGLIYSGQSGGINEAFSDMAGEAAEFFMWGTNDFLAGADIFKAAGSALRDMQNPSSDGVSIDDVTDYYNGLNVHYSSGVYNKAFHTLATTPNWDTKAAFRLFAYANRFLWTPSTSFRYGALYVIDAVALVFPVAEVEQRTADVSAAFAAVGIDVGPICTTVLPLGHESAETISGSEGSWTCFQTVVPAETTSLSITLTELSRKGRWKNTSSGDADLYLRFAELPDPSNPETSVEDSVPPSFDCRSLNQNSNESCVINTPAAGIWYSAVYGWTAYDSISIESTIAGSETPIDPTGGSHLGDLSASSENGSRSNRWTAYIDISLHLDDHSVNSSLENIEVAGGWSNGANGSGSCVSDVNGTCRITKNNIKNKPSVRFTVTSIDGSLGEVHDVSLNINVPRP